MAHVVVVEDDEPFAYIVERDLKAAGHEVSLFPDWTGVLELLESGAEVHAMVTDLRLPTGTPNGISLAHMAAKRQPALKVIYMTAFPDVAAVAMRDVPRVVIKGSDGRLIVEAVEAALAPKKAG